MENIKTLLIDVSIRTMIGHLPNIINNNNKCLSDYLNNIYDSSNNRIILSVYAMDDNGSVKSHFGEFVNLLTEHITIGNLEDKEKIVSGSPHSSLSYRYLYNYDGEVLEIADSSLHADMKKYAHNAGAIGLETGNGVVKSVALVINEILTDIDKVKDGYFGSEYNGSNKVGTGDMYVGVYGAAKDSETLSNPNSFTFDNSLLFASKVLLKRMNLPMYQYNDITSGFIYTYYDYSNVLTITDDHTASIKGLPGSVITLRFQDNKKKGFYRILLSRKEKKYLRISKDELVRLSIICTGNDDTYGTSWDVNNYAVRNPEDLVIERK